MPEPDKHAAATEAVDILHEIATILVLPTALNTFQTQANRPTQNTDLDRRAISICISLVEQGVNPEALAASVNRYAL